MPLPIIASCSVAAFFSEAVTDSIRARGVEATDGATRYLGALLADFARPDERAGETLDRPLTLLFDEAVRYPQAAERFERLRSLGDGVLYACGFFRDHFEARGVDNGYLHGLGTRAYRSAGAMLQHAGGHRPPDLFAELAGKFATFAGIVSDVADMTLAVGTETALGLLRAYERWLKTGSERLASALAMQGVLPTRGPAGVLQ